MIQIILSLLIGLFAGGCIACAFCLGKKKGRREGYCEVIESTIDELDAALSGSLDLKDHIKKIRQNLFNHLKKIDERN